MTPTIRCGTCKLNQFLTKSGRCRKCGQALVFEVQARIINPKPESLGISPLQIKVALSIRFIRQLKKLSQRDLAYKINVPRTLISKWENGCTSPSPISICNLADGLGISPQLIITVAEEIQIGKEEKITSRTA